MRFELIDRVLETSDDCLVAIKQVSMAEEYLQDHFPTFPVLPGVMMLETMVQAGRLLCEHVGGPTAVPLVLGRVRALKYGTFVKPGAVMRVTVTLGSRDDDAWDLKGEVRVIEPESGVGAGAEGAASAGAVACSGRLTLRPARVGAVG